ncbi:hypothetical protein NZK35_12550 [Stieleria sp. ICT_E10.1]|uniref:hypothetical protein n=1 Tax=Stieleria sedimenti TaxID=2976331 RepID=UPI00217FCD27|nr:hypothetical protein [Stieleria sedimenti]MCS7467477.1 hypothetical protein [Stieleria sedimenti]
MNRPQPFVLLVALSILGSGLIAGGDACAGGNSGWGWAKPLNKRMGAFYTSNKNANFSRQRSQRSSGYSYHRRLPTATKYVPAPAATVPQQHLPQNQLPPIAVPVSPSPGSAVPSPGFPKPQVAVWSAIAPPQQNTPAKPAVTASQAKQTEPLPHRSTTNSFWQ